MFGLSFRRKPTAPLDPLETLLADAAAGDSEARERLLRSYMPFVDRVVATTCGRPVTRTDDEFQIALLALNEAVDAYQAERGSFIGFAETVMKRRLIDSFRSTARTKEMPFSVFDEEDDEGNMLNAVEVDTAVKAFQQAEESAARADEIGRYAAELAQFGLSFAQLIEITPKHADARENALEVARLIADDPNLAALFLKNKTLPLKQLESRVTVSRKTLERQRNYIVAVVVVLLGDFEMLHAFVRKEGER